MKASLDVSTLRGGNLHFPQTKLVVMIDLFRMSIFFFLGARVGEHLMLNNDGSSGMIDLYTFPWLEATLAMVCISQQTQEWFRGRILNLKELTPLPPNQTS